jgi:hypothetical protein
MALLISFFFALFACESSEEATLELHIDNPVLINSDDCDSMLWNYQNVGRPYILTWCTSCHSSYLPEGSRGGSGDAMTEAPLGVDFNNYADVVAHKDRIIARIDAGMPPAGGVPDEDNLHVLQWLNCGAPE